MKPKAGINALGFIAFVLLEANEQECYFTILLVVLLPSV